ncbi:IgA peptidase M64-domain-containing protein, partial [Chytriomyces sp. MP71]
GPSENRIDFVFLGDGYTTDQRNLFIEDATRMTQEMFQVPGTSLHSILPMVNVRAIFVPSSQSGIQTSDSNTTAFGLTRFGSQYRGMYTLNKESARRALSGLGDPINVNYPMIIGNDPYYGGLEGELTTSTASKTSGVIVLRHELGHNLMDVGEEYDNSDNYFGTNTSSNANEVPWAHWITDPSMKEEKSAILLMDYAWYDLSQGPYTLNFTASGDYARYMMRFSLSGCNEDGAIKISVDGEELPNWTSKATLDRFFYDEGRDNGFKAGAHTIVFSEAGPRPEGAPIRQLCSVQVIEFGDKDEFHNDAEYVGRFPTYGIDGVVYYRPSGETCIMRCMVSNVFCRVCKETLLLNLLRRVSLIDNITAKHDNGFGSVQVSLLPFAQFRAPGMEVAGERYEVSWIVGGVERVDLKGILKLTDAAIEEGVEWWVVVKLVTPEIRKDDFEYTTSRAKIIWA